jgi:hypothetical protein
MWEYWPLQELHPPLLSGDREKKKKKTLDDCDNWDELGTYWGTAQEELILRRERM